MLPEKEFIATYRLQLTKDFTFDDARAITLYLQKLGISHVYLSPITSSTPGSVHGYDVTDFAEISPERGGRKGFDALVETLQQSGNLRLILDIVPNHMAATPLNPYWHDVLANGPDSPHWGLFDFRVADQGRIELPVLGSDRDEALKNGDITLARDGAVAELQYFETRFPLNAQSLAALEKDNTLSAADLLPMQHYDLVAWQKAFDDVSYRRFFDVVALAGVKVETEENYQKTHAALFDLLKDTPLIDGVRVDHIDGLADPAAYLQRLAKETPHVWVEKILGPGEPLEPQWPVLGATGYEFIDHVNRLFVNPAGYDVLREYWVTNIEPRWPDFQSCVADSKAYVLHDLFMPELHRLIDLTADDVSKKDAEIFWTGMTIGLPVYRTYKTATSQPEDGKAWINAAAEQARQRFGGAFTKAEKTFMPMLLSPQNDQQERAVREWQQLTGPVMAKGLEDTAHYRYTPLAALNEVGCNADIDDSEDFFAWAEARGRTHPASLNATSTHDTKRAEDARHRLYALADNPQWWIKFYEQACALNRQFNSDGTIKPATEYFLYQALLGTWPADNIIDDVYKKRIAAYMVKSNREARGQTSWKTPSEAYEKHVADFLDKIFGHAEFITLIETYVKTLALCGAINSLSVLTLKILSPGVPDIYQGTDIWDFSLVDPDNRRAVDYKTRDTLLNKIENLEAEQGREAVLRHLCQNWQDGGIKLWLTKTLLQIKRDYAIPPAEMVFKPLAVEGPAANHVIACTLQNASGTKGLIIVCPRYPCQYVTPDNGAEMGIPAAHWQQTRIILDGNLAEKPLQDLLTGMQIEAGHFSLEPQMTRFPVAILAF